MRMFGIGWAEMLLIAVVLVVAVKPEHLPEAARALGRVYGKLQRLIYESRLALEKEADGIRRATEKPQSSFDGQGSVREAEEEGGPVSRGGGADDSAK